MTRILHFSVDGLAGREGRISYELQPDVNVFFGLNGTGKTSLLRILYSAVRGRSEILTRVPFRSATVTFWSDDRRKEITRTITSHRQQSIERVPDYEISPEGFMTIGGSLRVKDPEPTEEWTTRPRSFQGEPFRIAYLTTTRLSGAAGAAPSSRYRYDEMSEAELDRVFAQEVTATWRRFNNRLLSQVRLIQSRGLAEILQSFFEQDAEFSDDSVFEADAYQRAREFLERQRARLPARTAFNTRYSADPKIRSVVNRIDRIESSIFEAEKPRRELERLIARFMTDKPVEFGDREIMVHVSEDEVIDLTLLSSGEKQLMRLLLAVVSADQATVIIDEPELSLHIDWQQELLSAMRILNEDAQIIAATHSPEIMSQLPDENIFRL